MIAFARPALVAGTLFASSLTGFTGDLGFAVDEATILEKSFAEATTWELSTFETIVDGEPMNSDMPDVEGLLERHVRISDEYGRVEDGLIHGLTREFTELSLDTTMGVSDMGQNQTFSTTSESSLSESIVSFSWNELEEVYELEVEEGDADDEVLEGLSIDMDLRELLPPVPVEEDDTWKVDAAVFASVVQAGGNLGFELSEADTGSLMGTPTAAILATSLASSSMLLAEPTGEVTAKLIGAAEVDGKQLAEIRFSGQLNGERDLSEQLQAGARTVFEESSSDDWTLKSTMEMNFEATLLWDLDEGHFHSFSLTGGFTGEHELAWSESMFDQKMAIEAVYEILGTSTIEIRIEE